MLVCVSTHRYDCTKAKDLGVGGIDGYQFWSNAQRNYCCQTKGIGCAQCELPDGTIVPHNYKGAGAGDFFCNQCTCTHGKLSCSGEPCKCKKEGDYDFCKEHDIAGCGSWSIGGMLMKELCPFRCAQCKPDEETCASMAAAGTLTAKTRAECCREEKIGCKCVDPDDSTAALLDPGQNIFEECRTCTCGADGTMSCKKEQDCGPIAKMSTKISRVVKFKKLPGIVARMTSAERLKNENECKNAVCVRNDNCDKVVGVELKQNVLPSRRGRLARSAQQTFTATVHFDADELDQAEVDDMATDVATGSVAVELEQDGTTSTVTLAIDEVVAESMEVVVLDPTAMPSAMPSVMQTTPPTPSPTTMPSAMPSAMPTVKATSSSSGVCPSSCTRRGTRSLGTP